MCTAASRPCSRACSSCPFCQLLRARDACALPARHDCEHDQPLLMPLHVWRLCSRACCSCAARASCEAYARCRELSGCLPGIRASTRSLFCRPAC